MEDLTLTVPGLWADHHVLAVRKALLALPGVAEVTASAMERTVHVAYEPPKVAADRIVATLDSAGYPSGELEPAENPPTDKPAWATVGLRTTATDPADLSMSGDYRKY